MELFHSITRYAYEIIRYDTIFQRNEIFTFFRKGEKSIAFPIDSN